MYPKRFIVLCLVVGLLLSTMSSAGAHTLVVPLLDTGGSKSAPFVYTDEVEGWKFEQAFQFADGVLHSDMTLVSEEGREAFAGSAMAQFVEDGSVLVTVLLPDATEDPLEYLFTPDELDAGSTCTPCILAVGIAAALGTAGCAFLVLGAVGCAIVVGGTASAGAAYCSANPCSPGPPSCTPSATIARSSGTNAVDYTYQVECTDTMAILDIRGDLVRNGSQSYAPHQRTCYATDWCADGWHVWGLPTGCYRARMSYNGQWRNPASGEVHSFAGQAQSSNQVCF